MEIAVFRWNWYSRLLLSMLLGLVACALITFGRHCWVSTRELPVGVPFFLAGVAALVYLVRLWTLGLGVGPTGLDLPQGYLASVLPAVHVPYAEITRIGLLITRTYNGASEEMHHGDNMRLVLLQTRSGEQHCFMLSLYVGSDEIEKQIRSRVALEWEPLEETLFGSPVFAERV